MRADSWRGSSLPSFKGGTLAFLLLAWPSRALENGDSAMQFLLSEKWHSLQLADQLPEFLKFVEYEVSSTQLS